MDNKIDVPDILMKLVHRHQSIGDSIGLGTKIIEHINTKVDRIVSLQEQLVEAERLLQDYQDLIKCDYGRNSISSDNKVLYMHDLSDALGENAAKVCERIYLETEEYFERIKK